MALLLKDRSVEAAVSDAPYSRSALIQAGSRDELLGGSLAELRRVLVPGRRMIYVDDRPVGGAISRRRGLWSWRSTGSGSTGA